MDMPFSEGAFQRHLNTIAANRQGYSSGFRPGTQTLDSRRFDEEKRKNEADALRQAMEFKEKKRQFDLSHDLARREMEYSLNKPYYNPASGGGKNKSNLAQITNAAKAAVWDYGSPEEAITAFKSYNADMVANGVDTAAVYKEMQNRWPHFDFGTNLDEKRALEEAGYIYINGKWQKKDY